MNRRPRYMFLFQSTGLQCFNKWESLFCLHNEQKVADHQSSKSSNGAETVYKCTQTLRLESWDADSRQQLLLLLLRSDTASSVCTNSTRRSPNGFCNSENSIHSSQSVTLSGYPQCFDCCQSIYLSITSSPFPSPHKRYVNSQFIFATWPVMYCAHCIG